MGKQFDEELLKKGVSKVDIDDFNNWLKQKPIAEKLDDFFTFNILMPLTTFWYFIQIPFKGLKWWKELNKPLCKDKTFESLLDNLLDDIKINNLDKAKKDLDILNHYEENWLSVKKEE